MTFNRSSAQSGAINVQLVVIIALLVVMVGLSGLSAWLYTQYVDQRDNVDSKVGVAVAEARKEQAEEDEKKYMEREKEPNREFAGPEDYGRLSFMYPKTWSVYIADDATTSKDSFHAYLHPVTIAPIDSKSARFALKVDIESIAYDKALDSFRKAVEKGDLKSSPFTANEHEGTRLDGLIAKDIRGSIVLFKVRDKTIAVSTQAETFKEDYEKIIKTINFND